MAQATRPIFNCPDPSSAQRRLTKVVAGYAATAPKLATWTEENLPQGFTVFALPAAHQQRLRATDSLERATWHSNAAAASPVSFLDEASLPWLVNALLAEFSAE